MLFDFAAISAHDQYKLLVATVVPRPIAWVVTLTPQGRVNAAPFSFFNVLSSDPPLVAFGIGGRHPGDAKDTGNNIRINGQFVVNLVPYDARDAMNVTSIDFPPHVDEIAEAGLQTLPSTHVAPPRIAQSPVALECERFTTLDVGHDRSIVLGRVLAIHIDDTAVLDQSRCYIDTAKLGLIGRMAGGGTYLRTEDTFELPRIPPASWPPRKPP